MGHIGLSPPVGSDTFTPIDKSYERVTKGGTVPVINFLLGSHYNVRIGGEMSITDAGAIEPGSTLKAVSGKLEITADATSGEVEKIGTFTSFMYFFPGVKLVGHSEVQDSDVGSGPIPIQKMQYLYQDLASGDEIIIDLKGGDGNAAIILRERVNDVVTDLVTQQLTVGVKEVFWELDFLEDGVTKFFYKEPSGNKTRIFNGQLKTNIAEAKAVAKIVLDQTVPKTVKSDFMWIFYPNIFVGYNIPILTNKTKARIRIFDQNNTETETNWIEVFSGDHKFVGERVVENGMVRVRFRVAGTMEVFGWNTTSVLWESIGSVVPQSTQGDEATSLQDVIFERFNDVSARIVGKFGIVDLIVDMKRGGPYVHIQQNTRKIRIATTTRRFALSTDVVTDIPDFNQINTDDVNRGNPLNLSPTNNPFIFTNDSNVNTGLLLLDDNWFSWYDETDSNNMVGFLGAVKRPTGLTVTATSSTALSTIDFSFDTDPMVVSVGVLESDPTAVVNGIPKPFNISAIDTYVKWRANESIFGFNEKSFLRRKR